MREANPTKKCKLVDVCRSVDSCKISMRDGSMSLFLIRITEKLSTQVMDDYIRPERYRNISKTIINRVMLYDVFYD